MSAPSPADFKFTEGDNRRKYAMVMENGEESRLTLSKVSPTHWIAESTFVPVPYRGKGISEALVERLIADARAESARITPACWYVRDEFARHAPDWDDVLKR